MKIYTKTGDDGTTSLIGGTRIAKNNLRIEAYGTIDELNSTIGMIRNYNISNDDDKILNVIQNKLFNIGSILACEDVEKYKLPQITETDILFLEKKIDKISENLENPKKFIIPAGSFLISWCNIARTICRRVERIMVGIENINKNTLVYINRLSDFLFVISREFAKKEEVEENFWNNYL